VTDTLHGLPVPEEDVSAARRAIEQAFVPVQRAWDQRAEDMLAVLADSSQARSEIKRAVRTIRLCAWCGVLAILLASITVWQVLERDRRESRKLRELDHVERVAAVEELGRRITRVCGR
jgi:hypothetical protein